ncbi:MAG: T9SS type A sorting domain-containing protein [Flavobacteriales bacterium]|nr:T9SS type A sorting domain-containing protein [Flavobacteriales bacterium]
MLDNGTVSFPRVLDYNADGLLDLLLTNRGKYQDGGNFLETFWLFENVGNPNYPIYELATENFMGLNDLGLGSNLVPAFGDIDGDGDLDMIIGDNAGKLHYFENPAGAGNSVQYSSYTTLLDDGGELLDLGASLVPQFFDLDNDGLLDLLVGERNGNINYLRNTGNLEEYEFTLIEDTIGDIVTDQDANLIGYSAPWFHRDSDGNVDVIFGTETGKLFYCDNIDTDPFLNWPITDSSAFDVFNGRRACPIMVDLDDDDKLDILNGNQSGGIGLYMGGSEPSSITEVFNDIEIKIYPNPSDNYLTLESTGNILLIGYEIFDLSGKTVDSERISPSNILTIDATKFSSGLYLIKVQSSLGHTMQRFAKE